MIKNLKLNMWTKKSFRIRCDTTQYSDYISGGIFTEIKKTVTLNFKSLTQSLEEPEFLIINYLNFDRHLTYTIFGQVTSGQDVANAIANVPRDGSDRPNTPVTIKHITIK